MEECFVGKNVVVTGAASGIGRATARAFAKVGSNVLLADVNLVALKELEKELSPARSKAFHVDCANRDSIGKFATEALAYVESKKVGGGIDILVNNAGVARLAPLAPTKINGLQTSDSAFESVWEVCMQVNVISQARLSRAFARSLARNKDGCIVNIASTEAGGATLFNAAYVASKHASLGLTRAMAVELGAQGIRVNSINPGSIETGMTDLIPADKKEMHAKRLVPLRRYGRPEEVADTIVAVCLPQLTYLNGAAIYVDGGHSANNALLPFKEWWNITPSSKSKL